MDTSNDEHDLAKALDSVAAELDAQKSGNSDDTSNKSGYLFSDSTSATAATLGDEPVIPPNSPIAPPAFAAPITPLSTPVDPTPPQQVTTGFSTPLTQTPEPFVPTPSPVTEPVVTPVVPDPVVDTPTPSEPSLVSTGNSELDGIKSDALLELRPLVDKLSVSPEEKFDTYLLLIRSTDDPALIAPAHEAAKLISDEARRAEALLDIIKEIDYLSKQKKSA